MTKFESRIFEEIIMWIKSKRKLFRVIFMEIKPGLQRDNCNS